MKFWLVWGFDALIAAVALFFFFFFFAGLANGRVSSFNIGLWLILLLGVAGIVGGSLRLRTIGHRGAAMAVLLILAVPGFLCVLFLVVALITHPRWN